jgi:Tfp pilus assembly protein PilO
VKKGPNPLVFLVMALVTFVVGGGMVFMQYTGLTEQTSRIEGLRKDRKDEKTVRAELAESQRKLDECIQKLSHLEQGVTESAYIPTMLKELERVGKGHGIVVTGVRPIPIPVKQEKDEEPGRRPKKAYQELLIEVKGRGKYGDVMRFMGVLQSFPKIVAVRTVSLLPKAGAQPGQDEDKLDVTVELKAYAFPPAETPADAKGASEEPGGMKITITDPATGRVVTSTKTPPTGNPAPAGKANEVNRNAG